MLLECVWSYSFSPCTNIIETQRGAGYILRSQRCARCALSGWSDGALGGWPSSPYRLCAGDVAVVVIGFGIAGGSLTVDPWEDVGIIGDPDLIGQLIVNLLENVTSETRLKCDKS
jgi:hypothetical protein